MLQIFVTNNIRIRGASTPLKAELTKVLTIDNPAYQQRKKRKQPTWGIESKIKFYIYDRGDIVAPRGFLEQLTEILRLQGITPARVITMRQTLGVATSFGWNPDYKLKDDQAPAVEAALARNGVLVAPAGSGKTVMAMRYIAEKGVPALWLTHTKDLMYQARDEAKKMLLDVGEIGILGDGKQDWGSGKLVIATVQTMQRNPHLVEALKPLIGTVVIDEAHHFPAPAFIDVAGEFPAVNMLGVTATPERKDQLESYLYMGIGPKVYEITRDGLYESGRLIKPEIKFIYTDFEYEQASLRNELDSVDAGGEDLDYNELLQELINDEQRANLVAETILEYAPNNYSIVITESVRYCYKLRNLVEKLAFERWGHAPRMAVVHGGISRYKWVYNPALGQEVVAAKPDRKGRTRYQVEDYDAAEMAAWQVTPTLRREIMGKAYNREIDILFATQLAREGLNMPHLTVGHMAMPKRGDAAGSKNGAAVEQEIGRIMRPDPQKPGKKAIWIDYVDYDVGVFKSQYYSRRSVYRRLGLKVPSKPKTETEKAIDFLDAIPW